MKDTRIVLERSTLCRYSNMRAILAAVLVGLVLGKPHSGHQSHGHQSHGHAYGHLQGHGNPHNIPKVGQFPVFNTDGCGTGQDPNEASHYIVGGKAAEPEDWPWQVRLEESGYGTICGGTLVRTTDSFAVITAAHCVPKGSKADDFITYFGSTHPAGGERIEVSNIVQHGNYDSRTLDNDIAVLNLKTKPALSATVHPACIIDTTPVSGTYCYVTGFGTTSSGGQMADSLQEVSKPLISDSQCNAYLDAIVKGEKITDTQLCAGEHEGGVDSCQGDSGGPLVCNVNGKWHLTGVVSWGYGCAGAQSPGVYSKVEVLRTWLQGQDILV